MRETGRKYGLRIDRYSDERRNIFKSTKAAIRYLEKLHELFGSWTLAAAAYNMGERGLQAEILAQETNDYYDLYLSLETRRYVLRAVALKLVFADPEKYGFYMKPEDAYEPLRFDRATIRCSRDTPILVIAKAANANFKTIKELNPEIRGHYFPKGNYEILIPEGSGKGFERRYEEFLKQWKAKKEKRVYIVQRGDTLSSIADRFNIPLPALLIWNRLDINKPIHPGDRITVYPE
jgi:hypothetical protein